MWNILNVSKSVKTPICNWNQRSGCDDTLPRSDMLMTYIIWPLSHNNFIITVWWPLTKIWYKKNRLRGYCSPLYLKHIGFVCNIIKIVFQNRALDVFRDQIDISGGWVYKVMLICLKFCHLIKIVMHTLNYNGFWCTV